MLSSQRKKDREMVRRLKILEPKGEKEINEEAFYIAHLELVTIMSAKFKSLLPEDIESLYIDAFQATLTNIRRDKFQFKSNLKTYFRSIFHNMCVTFSKKKNTSYLDLPLHITSDFETKLKEKALKEKNYQALYTALSQLSEKCQLILQLAFWEKLKNKEIAKIPEVGLANVGVVKTQRRRCMIKLRELMKSQ